MRRAPTTSRVMLALGALTLAVLAATLLTKTNTAAAHEAEIPPNPTLFGEEEGACPDDDDPTLGDNEGCVEGKEKRKWYHQNYWFPCVGTSSTNCVLNKTANQPEYKDQGHKWHQVALRHFTSSPLNLPDRTTTTLTEYLAQVETKHPSWQRSWCGVGNDTSPDAKPFDTWKEADDANCGHRNRPHGYFNHQPTEEIVPTRTVYVKAHNHCDDDTHPSDHDNDTCPEDVEVCEVTPPTPVVTKDTARNAALGRSNTADDARTAVTWTRGAGGVLCEITEQEMKITLHTGLRPNTPTLAADDKRYDDVPNPSTTFRQITVEVRVGNDNEDETERWSDWGVLRLTWPDDDEVCETVPGVPTRERQSGLDHRTWSVRVSWDAPASDGDAGTLCNVTGYEVRVIDAATGATRTRTPDYGTTAADRRHNEQAATTATGTKTVEIRARNEKGLGDPATVTLHPRCPRGTDNQGDLISSVDSGTETGCNDEPPPVCPLPAAPVVTKHNKRVGPPPEQLVRWEITNPPVSPCEVTGWLIYYGTDAARDKSAGTTSSWERKPVPGSRIRVFVRAENRVRPGSTAKQLSNSGDVDLYGDCPAGTTHAGKPMDDPAGGGTVEGCNNDDGGCPLPAAPVLTSDPDDTDSSRLVTWTVADPAGEDCEITGQELRRVPQRGISSTRDRDKNTRQSTQSVTDRTGAVVVSVRAKNRAQPGGSDQQCGGLVTVRGRARNQVGWGEGATEQVRGCRRLPGQPELTLDGKPTTDYERRRHTVQA